MGFSNTLITFVIVASLALTTLTLTSQFPARAQSCGGPGTVNIDVFTQKAPFDGKGEDRPSDMFGPQETVILYAFVLVNNTAANGILITFQVTGPTGLSPYTVFYLEAETNASGLAETEFTLQIMNQTEVFGTWSVIGSTIIDGKLYTDILTFQVNWIIEFVSIRTLDENLTDQESFGKDGYVGVEVALINNAEVVKNATVEITIFDVAHVPINTVEITNFTVPPNQKVWRLYTRLHIETYALVGMGSVVAVALNENGTAFSPEIFKNFTITILDPLSPNFLDASVYIGYVPQTATPGQTLTIPVVTGNKGTLFLSSLTVTLYVNNATLISQSIDILEPYDSTTFYATWNTTDLPLGNYTITATVQTFPNEADLTDNSYSITVELTTPEQPFASIRDLQISNITSSSREVTQGETVEIEVTLKNNGNFTESTTVGVYFNSSLIEEHPLTNLPAGNQQVLVFQWNTSGIPPGTYQITAIANPVQCETHVEDNTLQGGQIKIDPRVSPIPPFPPLPSGVTITLILIGAAVIAGLILLFIILAALDRIKRPRKGKKKSYVVLVHPHI